MTNQELQSRAQLYIWPCILAWVIMASYIGERTRHMGVWKWLAGSSFTVYVMHRLINSKISAVGLMILNGLRQCDRGNYTVCHCPILACDCTQQ